MQLTPVLNKMRASLEGQRSLAGDDPAVADAAAALVEALGPALRIAAMDLAQQAATEIAAQLDGQSVEVLIVDDDPTLRVSTAPDGGAGAATGWSEELDARITLRLPPSLKSLIEDAATGAGNSVNSWVVDALHNRATKSSGPSRGGHVTEGFDL